MSKTNRNRDAARAEFLDRCEDESAEIILGIMNARAKVEAALKVLNALQKLCAFAAIDDGSDWAERLEEAVAWRENFPGAYPEVHQAIHAKVVAYHEGRMDPGAPAFGPQRGDPEA